MVVKTYTTFSVLLVVLLSSQPGFSDETASPRLTIQQSLGFEQQGEGPAPTGWQARPDGSAFADAQVVHSGHWSVRLESSLSSNGAYIRKAFPVDFEGKEIELRGYLKTKEVGNFAGLWMNENGDGGTIAYDNMDEQHVDGTRDWKAYTIKLPIDPSARTIAFGVLVTGTGTVWADDLELLVDGKPIADAKAKAPEPLTAFDTDREFDGASRIAIPSLTPVQIDNLVTLGRIWGFLKYHHPVVTTGRHNWDYDLFRVLPAVLAATDRSQANAALVRWVDALGAVPVCKADQCAPAPSSDLDLKPEVDWVRDETRLGTALSERLQAVYKNRLRNSQFYVSLRPNANNPYFDHERTYDDIHLPDSGFQLLGLYRWWNIMQYWSPYREVAGQDWTTVLSEFIPKVALAKDRNAYQLAMLELIAHANDTHANLWDSLDVRPPVGRCGLPLYIRFVADQAVVEGVTGPTSGSAFRIGDIIESLDGVPLSRLIAQWTPYYADSNVAARRRDMAGSLTRGECGAATVGVVRDGMRVELHTERLPQKISTARITHDLAGPTFRLLSEDVAYLKLSSIKATDVPRDMELAKSTKGLIVDIRNYPSDFMPFVLGPILAERHTTFVQFTSGDLSNPGVFRFAPPLSYDPGPSHYSGKVVILVDEISQSQAEYTAMALRAAPNAIVVGSMTAGADGDVSRFFLPGGMGTMISGLGVYYPDRQPTQRVGIRVDVEARPTVAGIKAGRDEVLEAGIRQIQGPDMPEEEIERLERPLGP